MAIDIVKKEKSQKNLMILAIVIIIIVIIVLWQMFLKKDTPYVPEEVIMLPSKQIKINFGVFEQVKEFRPFETIKPFEEISPTEEDSVGIELGRENPFLSY